MANKNIAASIILCTYNREQLLPRMLDSLLMQTFQDYEIILINNGSTDGTDRVCRQYAERDDRIRYYVLSENHGAARARNFGLDHVSGRYVSMVDDDDYCMPDMFETLYAMTENYQADIAVVGCQYRYSDHIEDVYNYDEEYLLEGSDGLRAFLERKLYNTIPGTKLFAAKLFQGLRWVENTKIDDIHFIYKLFVKAKRVVTCGKPLYQQYKHDGNMTSFLSGNKLTEEVLDDYLAMQDERVAYVSAQVPELTALVGYSRVSYMISMVERIEKGDAVGCEKQLQYMKTYLKQHQNELLETPWATEREKNLMDKYILEEAAL